MAKFNDAGLALLKDFEGCKLYVYVDEAGIPTTGYGHVVEPEDDLTLGQPITQEQADSLLLLDTQNAQNIVNEHITVELNDNQFSACVCFAYNAGSAPFVGRFGELLNGGDYAAASDDFTHWDHIRINGQLSISDGLLRRCIAEQRLFNLP